jgi:hypothetical protein
MGAVYRHHVHSVVPRPVMTSSSIRNRRIPQPLYDYAPGYWGRKKQVSREPAGIAATLGIGGFNDQPEKPDDGRCN